MAHLCNRIVLFEVSQVSPNDSFAAMLNQNAVAGWKDACIVHHAPNQSVPNLSGQLSPTTNIIANKMVGYSMNVIIDSRPSIHYSKRLQTL